MTSQDVGPEAAGRPRVSLEEIEAEIRRGVPPKADEARLRVVEAKPAAPDVPKRPRTVEMELGEVWSLVEQLCEIAGELETRIGVPTGEPADIAKAGELVSLLERLARIRVTLGDVRARLDACMAALG